MSVQTADSDVLLMLNTPNHRTARRALDVRGIEAVLVEEVRRRVRWGRIVDDRVNLLPGHVFVNDPGSDARAWALIEDAGLSVPRARPPVTLPRSTVESWQAAVDADFARRSDVPRRSVAPCLVDDPVVVLLFGTTLVGTCTWVGTKYVRVRLDSGGRTMEVPFSAVALLNGALHEPEDGVMGRSAPRSAPFTMEEQKAGVSHRRRRNKARRRRKG